MENTHLNYLMRAKRTQEMTQEIIKRYVYIAPKEVWELLCVIGEFHWTFPTYLRHLNEKNLEKRIELLQSKEQPQEQPQRRNLFGWLRNRKLRKA